MRYHDGIGGFIIEGVATYRLLGELIKDFLIGVLMDALSRASY